MRKVLYAPEQSFDSVNTLASELDADCVLTSYLYFKSSGEAQTNLFNFNKNDDFLFKPEHEIGNSSLENGTFVEIEGVKLGNISDISIFRNNETLDTRISKLVENGVDFLICPNSFDEYQCNKIRNLFPNLQYFLSVNNVNPFNLDLDECKYLSLNPSENKNYALFGFEKGKISLLDLQNF